MPCRRGIGEIDLVPGRVLTINIGAMIRFEVIGEHQQQAGKGDTFLSAVC